jgi:hypothetical protein
MITAKFVRQELREMIDSLKDIGVNSEEINGVIDRYSCQLCKEQREICKINLNYSVEGISYVSLDSIINAPMPTL